MKIRPITNLRKYTKIVNICRSKKEPIYITKNGYGGLVIMSIEKYEELIENIKFYPVISDEENKFENDRKKFDLHEN